MASSAVRTAGEMTAGKWAIAVKSDCDSVTVTVLGVCVLRFTSEKRDQFARLFFAAERQTEAWAAEHGGGS